MQIAALRRGRLLILMSVAALAAQACGSPRGPLPPPVATSPPTAEIILAAATDVPAVEAALVQTVTPATDSALAPTAEEAAAPATPASPATEAAGGQSASAATAAPEPDFSDGPRGATLAGRVEGFEVVGRHALGSRGWNAGLALAYPCAYIGNRRVPAISIVDVTNPAEPALAGYLSLAPGGQAVELRAVPDLGLLVVLNFQPQATILTYDVTDCRQPRQLGALSLGAVPHEFFLWRDPHLPGRLLVYAAMWHQLRPDLHVVDLSQPATPRWLGAWTSAAEMAEGSLHSLSVSDDGHTAYLALWEGGLLLADVSDFALGLPEPRLRLVRDQAGFSAAVGQAVHSAVPLAGGRYVLLTEESYTCPFAGLLIADAIVPAHPRIVGRFALPENDPDCAGLPQADAVFTAHNPLVAGHLAFVTWYGGGLQVLDVSNPEAPSRVALFVPDGQGAADRSYVGSYPVQLWSYPILRQGLIYVADIQSGLHILRYTGPGAEGVNSLPLAEGNVTVLGGAGQ
jgi:hypothetical protein